MIKKKKCSPHLSEFEKDCAFRTEGLRSREDGGQGIEMTQREEDSLVSFL